jgi:hypothetical protein
VEVCDCDGFEERRAVAGFCGRDRDWDWWSSIVLMVVVLVLADAAAAAAAAAAMIVIRPRIDLRSLCSLV